MGQYNTGVLTTAGQQLITQALAGDGIISFPLAKTSSWAIPAGTNIQALTDLQDIQQTVTPGTAQIFNGTMIQVQALFSNANQGSEVTEAYLVQTVGLWAQITGGEPTLFSVYQATTPDQMPAYAGKAPSSLIYTLQATVQQASQLTVQVNPAGAATALDIQNLQTQITQIENDYIPKTQIGAASGVAGLGSNSAVPIAQGGTGGNTITEALANLGAQPGFNLLVNSRFKYNGRNQNNYIPPVWTADGWFANSGSDTVVIIGDDIAINGCLSIYQSIQDYFGKTLTFSVKDGDGNIYSVTGTLPETKQNVDSVIAYSKTPWGNVALWNSTTFSNFTVDIKTDKSATITAAKLEIGSLSTLAADLEKEQDETLEQLRLDMYDLDPGRPAYILTQNENLLDNWYFVGGGSQQGGGQFPINQRGQTSYSYSSNGAYFIDRWAFWDANSSVTLNSDNITLFNSSTATGGKIALSQFIESSRLEKNAPYVLSVLVDEISQGSNWLISTDMGDQINAAVTQPGLVSQQFIFTAQKDKINIYIWKGSSNSNDNIKIKAVKLELGTRSTLARLVDGQWVLNDPPPNFQQELAKCQRYQVELVSTADPEFGPIGVCTGDSGAGTSSFAVAICPLPVPMRIKPTVITSGLFTLKKSPNVLNVSSVTVDRLSENAISLNVTVQGTVSIGEIYQLWYNPGSGNCSLLLDANL